MRDKRRIKRILKLVEEIWTRNPDWRFGQLLINFNVVKDDFKTWQTEDDIWEKYLIQITNLAKKMRK